jgi:hypothetical protein
MPDEKEFEWGDGFGGDNIMKCKNYDGSKDGV